MIKNIAGSPATYFLFNFASPDGFLLFCFLPPSVNASNKHSFFWASVNVPAPYL